MTLVPPTATEKSPLGSAAPMRKTLILALGLLLLSGCLSSSGGDGDAGVGDGAGDGAGTNATAPAPLHWAGDILVGADPFNLASTVVATPPCSQDVSSCTYYDFSVNTTVDLTATLAWGVQANDLDLYLYQGDKEVSQDGINAIGDVPPVTSQVMHASIAPGDYTFWVVVWNGAADSYTLDVAFS